METSIDGGAGLFAAPRASIRWLHFAPCLRRYGLAFGF
jgi:hypothetical protein